MKVNQYGNNVYKHEIITPKDTRINDIKFSNVRMFSCNIKPENKVPKIGIKKLKNDKNPTELYLINIFHKEKDIAVLRII